MDQPDYKKYFLRTLVIALAISAAIGIFIFLVGDFGEIEIRLLLTTLTIGGFSLTGLCSATIQGRNDLRLFSRAGMLTSVLGFAVTVGAIWELVNTEQVWKWILVLVILSIATAHISLLLLLRPRSNNIKYALTATVVCITLVALMLVKSTLSEFEESEFYFRLLGVFGILDVLGTIATPILNRIAKK